MRQESLKLVPTIADAPLECEDVDCSFEEQEYEYVKLLSIGDIDVSTPEKKKDVKDVFVAGAETMFKKIDGQKYFAAGTRCPRGCDCFINRKKLAGNKGWSAWTSTTLTGTLRAGTDTYRTTAAFNVRSRTLWGKCGGPGTTTGLA